MSLNDKIAIVTGATKGIGKATAIKLAQQGATVFINGRNKDELEETHNEMLSNNLDVHMMYFSVDDPETMKDAFREFLKTTKKLDILVNNAGVLDDALIGMVTQDQILNTFKINTFSVINLCQYASRIMRKNKSGSIVNISSIIGTNGNAGQAVYGGSKAGVIGITKSLAKELALDNIRVNAICPGFINTDMAHSIPKDIFEKRIESIAMGRIGEPEEVANLVSFLSSNDSSYITGQIIGIDGGMLI